MRAIHLLSPGQHAVLISTHNIMMPCRLELVRDWLKGSTALWSVLHNMPCKDLPLPRTTHNQLGGFFDLECALHH